MWLRSRRFRIHSPVELQHLATLLARARARVLDGGCSLLKRRGRMSQTSACDFDYLADDVEQSTAIGSRV
jgi:hypothetical protein